MKSALLLAATASVLLCCSDDPDFSPVKNRPEKAEEHQHGDRGGDLISLGDPATIVEVVVNHDKKTLELWCYDHDRKNAALLNVAPVLSFERNGVATEVSALPKDNGAPPAHHWVIEHAALAGDPCGMKLAFTIGDKVLVADVPHHH